LLIITNAYLQFFISLLHFTSPSNAVTFITDAYTMPGLITAVPLDTTWDPCETYKLSGTCGECLLAWCILFVSTGKWNAQYV